MAHEEEGMDKYGVDEQAENLEKKASAGCPSCGLPPEKLVTHGRLIMCPNCGTEPFE